MQEYQAVPSKVSWLLRSAHPTDARSSLLDQGQCSPIGQGGDSHGNRLCHLCLGCCWPDFHWKTVFPHVDNQSSTIWVKNAYVGGVLKLNFYGIR